MKYKIILSAQSLIWKAAKENKKVEGKIVCTEIEGDKNDHVAITFDDGKPAADEEEKPTVILL